MKWGKYAKICVEMLKSRLFLADPSVPTTLTLFTPEEIQKNITGLRFPKISVFFSPEQIFRELFLFTHGTFYFGTPCI